ncbi:hypothetical protein [Actinoplanes sp. NPDC049681]|uniref:hypothetical protein n=1 Tax=Actinoplanes sp. NPDC049681 TaxID=3363905 RepID=UPI0037B65597
MTATLDDRVVPGTALLQDRIGNALVLHPDEPVSDEARDLALRIAADPGNDIVVLDLPEGVPFAVWQSLVRTWPRRRRRGVRLVTCRSGPGTAGLTAQWLAQLLRCVVHAPDGKLTVGPTGTVLAHSSPDSGWLRFRPGKPPVWSAKRYPAPAWDAAAVETRTLGPTIRAEPLTGGLWIHDTRDPQRVERHRTLLETASPCDPDAMTVVLGCPGTPPLVLDAVRLLWDDLTDDQRTRLRFAAYGPVTTPDGDRLGQTLADVLGAPVVCFAGLPLTAPYEDAAYPIRADGEPGWPAFARELGFSPRILPVSLPRRPVILGHRLPLDLGEEVAPLTYRADGDVWVEIVEAGLWVRPPQAPDHAERVRGLTADPDHCAVLFEDGLLPAARRLAERLTDARVTSRARPASELVRPDPERTFVAPPADPEEPFVAPAPDAEGTFVAPPPAPERWNEPTPLPVESRTATMPATAPEPPSKEPPRVIELAPPPRAVQPAAPPRPVEPAEILPRATPTPFSSPPVAPVPLSAPPLLVPRPASSKVDKDRDFLRRTLAVLDPAADVDSLTRAVAADPDDSGAVAESIALRWYLTRGGTGLDPLLCTGEDGDHRRLADLASAALERLPRQAGAVTYARTPAPQEWEMYQDARLIADWGFVHALTEPCAAQDGDTNVLIWSLTAARTGDFEPDDDAAVTDRVVFRPGTMFKVLELRPPRGRQRGSILLRELDPAEDGGFDPAPLPADAEAVTSLLGELRRWALSRPQPRAGAGAAARFDRLPGLI